MTLNTAFKTLPTNQAITSLSLGLGPDQGSKIFASSHAAMRGLTKKGNDFYKMNLPPNEGSTTVRVHNNSVFIAGRQVIHQYTDGEPAHEPYHLDGAARISAYTIAPIGAGGRPGAQADDASWWPLLGRSDGKIEVLKKGEPYLSLPTEGAVSCLTYHAGSVATMPGNKHAGRVEIIYGTNTGGVAQIYVDDRAARRGWALPASSQGGGGGGDRDTNENAVTAIHTGADLTRDGVPEVVIGRANGTLEVYRTDEMGGVEKIATLAVSPGDALATITSGTLSGAHATDELLVHTRAGRVVVVSAGGLLVPSAAQNKFMDAVDRVKGALAGVQAMKIGQSPGAARPSPGKRPFVGLVGTDTMATKTTTSTHGKKDDHEDLSAMALLRPQDRLKVLQQELKALQTQLDGEKFASGQRGGGGGGGLSGGGVSLTKSSLTLREADGVYDLIVEGPDGMDAIVVHSTTYLEFEDLDDDNVVLIRGGKASTSSSTSTSTITRTRTSTSTSTSTTTGHSSTSPQDGWHAWVRASNRPTMIQISLRPLEGLGGKVSVFPTISGAEGKSPATMCATIPMRPLCYHVPLELEEVDYSRPYSQLVVTGNFSMPQVHTWLGAALSGLPAMPSGLGLGLGGAGGPSPDDGVAPTATVAFQSCLINTILIVRYEGGLCDVKSDNLATLAIVREHLAKYASQSRQQVTYIET